MSTTLSNLATLQQALLSTPQDAAQLPAPVFAQLLSQAEAIQAFAKQVKDFSEQASELRFGAQAQAMRQRQGHDFATVRISDGAQEVVCEIRKIVDWDQAHLASLAAKISAAGEDPTQYLELAYKVAESKYKAWPDTLKAQFSAARTERPGKASYRLQERADKGGL